MKLNAHTQLNLIIGSPVKHSQSPALHDQLYTNKKINAVMIAIENPELPALIQSIKTLQIGLTAVTLPFKTSILDHVDKQSDEVQALEAANTLIYKNGILKAYNTDVDGINASLKGLTLGDRSVLILGAGGAARACGYVLSKVGAHLFWANRTHDKAQALAERWGGQALELSQVYQQEFDLIINATSVGLSPNTSDTPLPDYVFKPAQTVFDLIYTPIESRLLKEAKSAGATVINGETMFIAQAKKQIELWREAIELHDH